MKFIATSFLYINSWGWGWHFYSNLVVLATIETMSNKKGKNLLVTHNQEYKKKKKNKIIIIARYMHFLVGIKHVYLY